MAERRRSRASTARQTGRVNAAGRATVETATERVSRLLAMVPWILANPGTPTHEVAQEFAISEEQLVEDLQLLFLCGTPGGSHLELIDAEWDTGRVWIRNADDIARPMRLSRDEAVALTAGLHALPATGTDTDVVERTLAKLRAAITATGADTTMDLEIDDGNRHPAYAPLMQALREHRRVHLAYYVETRDESTQRDVDPMRIMHLDGRWYLEGWCHRAADVRLFRLDRIEEVRVLEVDGTPPPQARPRDADAPTFVGSADDLVVELELDPDAAWVADYYPNESVERGTGESGTGASGTGEHGGGTTRVTMRVADPQLIRRLVLNLGGTARVSSPEWLARSIAEEAARALSRYGAPEDPGTGNRQP